MSVAGFRRCGSSIIILSNYLGHLADILY